MRGSNNDVQQLGANEKQQVKRYLRECQQKHDNEEKQSSINK
jgi:hypothetical protein